MQALAKPYTNFQATVLVVLRILIGWHFLYEGLAKLTNPYWSSAGYLSQAQWWFDGTFLNIAASPSASQGRQDHHVLTLGARGEHIGEAFVTADGKGVQQKNDGRLAE